jgi:hypothetical protein
MGNNLIIGSTQELGDNFVVPITSSDGPFLDCKLILTDFSPDFKRVVLSHLDKLLSLPYMVGKLEMFSF